MLFAPPRPPVRSEPPSRTRRIKSNGQDCLRDAARLRTPVRRGGRRVDRAVRRAGARGAVRPVRSCCLRARASHPPRRSARRGRGAGRVPHGVAPRGHVHARTCESVDLVADARPPACGRPCAPRRTPPSRADRGCGRGSCRQHGGGRRVAALRARARADGAATASRPAARGARARVLRRLHAVRARGETGTAHRYEQVEDVQRPRPVTRSARGARAGREEMGTEALHDLTAAYALDALDEDERRDYEAHLARCERCREELVSLSEGASSLAYAVDAPAPSPQLRERILASARAERPNVVPLRPRWALPAAAVAVVAVAAAIALAIWAASLSNRLDRERALASDQERVAAILAAPDAHPYGVPSGGLLAVTPSGEAALVLTRLEAAR